MKSILFPILVGACIVGQASLNRKIFSYWNLPLAVILNMTVAFVVSFIYLLFEKKQAMDLWTRLENPLEIWHWWFLLPGLFGVLIVTLIPLALAESGALKVFVITIGSQMIFSLLVDSYFHQIPLTPSRWLGAILSVLSIVIINY